MATLAGILGLADSDRSFVSTIGQRVVYEAAQQMVDMWNQEVMSFMDLFLEETTEQFKERYVLPGGGQLERRGPNSTPASVKASGYWDVAYPLEDFGASIGGDDVTLAYMTLPEMTRHLQTVFNKDANTLRFEMLKALFNNTTRTFVDPIRGSLSIVPLANGDSVTYPPVQGTTADATATHYVESNYAASAISDTNNPFATAAATLKARWGAPTGGAPIVAFSNSAQNAKIVALTDFESLVDYRVVPSVNANRMNPVALPPIYPGEVIGITSSCINIQWDWIPANYILFVHTGAPKPLKLRVDPADTGLPQGLALVNRDDEKPLQNAFWRHRFGVGVGNRLNGYVMELGTGGTYTIPTAYA